MPSRSRILFAVVNQTDVETWKKYLSEFDCETDVATDGAETLNYVTRFRPHLILLNPMMPTVNGFDICRQIKETPATRNTMVLMVSDVDELSDIERAVAAGTDDFLSIPVSKSELLNRVENLLKRSRL